jgi:hypothetical protein
MLAYWTSAVVAGQTAQQGDGPRADAGKPEQVEILMKETLETSLIETERHLPR